MVTSKLSQNEPHLFEDTFHLWSLDFIMLPTCRGKIPDTILHLITTWSLRPSPFTSCENYLHIIVIAVKGRSAGVDLSRRVSSL